MFLSHEQDVTEKYFFFSQGSNSADKNEFVSQYTIYSLISLSHTKDEKNINNQ